MNEENKLNEEQENVFFTREVHYSNFTRYFNLDVTKINFLHNEINGLLIDTVVNNPSIYHSMRVLCPRVGCKMRVLTLLGSSVLMLWL